MSINYISIDQAQEGLYTGSFGEDLYDYDGYICDAITEIADSRISVYTADQIEFANDWNNNDYVQGAIIEGLALSGADYFSAHPDNNAQDYLAHVGAAGWYQKNSADLYEHLDDSMAWATLQTLKDTYGITEISEDLLDNIKCELENVDNNDRLSDTIESACTEALACFEQPLEQIKAQDPEKFKSYLIEQNLMDPEVENPRDPNLDVLEQEDHSQDIPSRTQERDDIER